MNKAGLQKYALLIIPVLFLIYSSPSALDYVFHYADEKRYTDSAIQMIEKDDYFTPYKADGSPRFLKPIATYWILIGSYKIFGISPFSSRLFFWLAGAVLSVIIYLMAKSFSGDKRLATTAAFITASNPLVILSSSRSIPDILLVLFLTISAWGFMEIMLREKPSKKFYWIAYMGSAIAFETKGIPAAAFAGISMLFLLFNPWKKVKLKKLLDPVSIIVSVLVALSWFIIMYFEHGSMYLETFFADQVGERVSSKLILVIKNGALGIITLIAFLLPWIIIVFSKPKKLFSYISNSNKKQKAIFGFILTWVILIILMSGAVFKFYDRYLLPVLPLCSIFLASVLVNSETRFKKQTLNTLLVLNLLILTISILYATFIMADTILIIGILFSVAIITKWFLGVFKNISTPNILANGILLLVFNVFILLHPLLMPSPGKQMINSLHKLNVSKNDQIYTYGSLGMAANMRVQCNNTLNIISMDTIYTMPNTQNHYLVFKEKEKDLLNLKNYTILTGSEEWLRLSLDKFPPVLKTPVLNIKNTGTKYLIAKPKD